MPSQNRRRFGKFLMPDDHGSGSSHPLPVKPPLGPVEIVALGVGDRVEDGVTGRCGVIQSSYIEDRMVLYSVRWEEGTHAPRKASELRLLQRRSPL